MPRNTRDDLIDAAGRLFAREGFTSTGINRVLAEAGVEMTLYKHFKSQDELIAAALEQASVSNLAFLESNLSGSGAERVLSFFDVLARWCTVKNFSGCIMLNAMAEFKDPKHPVRVVVRRHAQRLRDLLGRLVNEAGITNADELADQLMLLVEGMIEISSIEGCVSCGGTAKRAARTLIAAAG